MTVNNLGNNGTGGAFVFQNGNQIDARDPIFFTFNATEVANVEAGPGWTGHEGVLGARQRDADTMAELPPVVIRLQRGEAAIPTIYEEY